MNHHCRKIGLRHLCSPFFRGSIPPQCIHMQWSCVCSVAQSCPTLCSPIDCSMLGLPSSCLLSRWCHPAVSSSDASSALNLSQHQGLFQWVGCSHQMTKLLELQLQSCIGPVINTWSNQVKISYDLVVNGNHIYLKLYVVYKDQEDEQLKFAHIKN